MKNRPQILSIGTRQTKIFFLFVIIWLLLFLSTFVLVFPVAAHSGLVRSQPSDGASLESSPAQVTAWFSEELDSQTSNIRVFDAQDRQVDNGDGSVDLNDLDHLSMVVSLPPLPAGIYSVRWTAASAEDGDATEGEFTFKVTGGNVPGEVPESPAGISLVLVVGIIVGAIILSVLAIIAVKGRKESSQLR